MVCLAEEKEDEKEEEKDEEKRIRNGRMKKYKILNLYLYL